MSERGKSLSSQFRSRRGVFSDRVSARGHRFEFSEWEALHGSIERQIQDMAGVLLIAKHASDGGSAEAAAQVTRLRGALGNLRQIIRDQLRFNTADVFMTVARHLLPQHIFDDLLVQARWLRSLEAKDACAAIDEVMRRTNAASQPIAPIRAISHGCGDSASAFDRASTSSSPTGAGDAE